jgi:glycosyltransferase involved in cell wall biosynthesis
MHVAMLCDYPLDRPQAPDGREQEATPVINLIAALSRLDIRLSIIGVYKSLEKDERTSLSANCILYRLRAPRFSGMPVAFFPRVLRIHSLLRALKPDIVHGQGTEREYAAAAVLSGFSNVITVHGILREVHRVTRPPLFSPAHAGRWVESLVFTRARNMIAISPYAERQLRKYGSANLFSIPNAVNRIYFEAARRLAGPTFVFVGSLYPLKGVDDLIGAARILDSEGRHARIVIIGPATSLEYERSLRRDSERLNHVKVEYLGWQPAERIAEEFSSATALVHPSHAENAPMAVAEALCAGVPVIATPVGALSDWIKDGGNGCIVPTSDPRAIANKMRLLLDDPALAIRMGAAARRDTDRFRPESIAKATLHCYETLLQDAGAMEKCRAAVGRTPPSAPNPLVRLSETPTEADEGVHCGPGDCPTSAIS